MSDAGIPRPDESLPAAEGEEREANGDSCGAIPFGSNSRISLRDPKMRGAWLVFCLAVAVAVAHPPGVLVNGDEYYYAGQATTITHGRLVPQEGDGLAVPVQPPERAVKYPPGWPLLLAAGRVVSVRGMWVVTLLVHLAGGLALGRMLARRGIPSWTSAVWVFHPAAWLYSRTIMSDAAGAAVLIVAMDAWENRSRYLVAAALALAPALRIANLLAVAGFGVAVVPETLRRKRDALVAVTAVLVGIAADLFANHAITGRWMGSPYASATERLIGTQMLLENAVLYGAGLLLLPPFPLAWMVAEPRGIGKWAVAALPLGVFLLFYGYHDVGANPFQTLVGGQRLALPMISVLIVASADAWSARRSLQGTLSVCAVGCALAVSLAMSSLERRFEPAVRALTLCRPATIAYNGEAGRVALAVDAERYVAVDAMRPWATGADVVVLASQYRSNRPGATTPVPSYAGPLPGRCYALGDYRVIDLAGRCPDIGPRCAQ